MPDVPLRDAARVAWLERLALLDLVPEQVFDDIAALASQICGTPVALLTLVGETEQWFKARVGIDATGTPRDISFCTHAIEQSDLFVVEDASLDPRFAHNPLVTGGPQVRFYMGAPFRSHDGVPLGTICVLDVVPRSLRPEQRGALRALARQVEALLELRRRTIEAEVRGRELDALQELLRETSEKATTEAELLAAIMAEMPEPVMLFAPDGTILRFNKAAEESYGYSPGEVIGENAFILQPPGYGKETAEVRSALDARGSFRGTVTGVTKTGESFPVETAIRVISTRSAAHMCLAVNRDLREQNRAAEQLFASNELFRNVFDCAAVGMALVEIGGRVQRVNSALASLYEMEVSQLVGRPVTDFVLPEALEQVRLVLPALLAADATSFHVESSIRAKSGVRAVVASISIVKDITGQSRLYAIQLQDITERRAAEAKLRESEAVFRMVAEHSSDIITRLGTDGRYLYVTPAVERITGFSPSEIIHRSAFQLMHPNDAWQLETAEAVVAGGFGPLLYQHRMRCKDGSYRWVETSARPTRDASGAILEWHAATRDISERKAAELKLIAAMQAAESASRAKSVFLGNMSHELRTPLNAILGFARVLERARHGNLNAQQSGYVRDIIESGSHMLVLVEELLELRSLEDGLSRFVIGPMELKAALADATRMTYELAFEKRHTFVIDEVTTSLKVVADHRAVVQILVNLVSNAIKYTPPSGRIRVFTDIDDEVVTVHVQDNGVGLTVGEQSQLFREFDRLGRRAQGDAPGTGLGLALTRRLVEALGGEVFVQSAPGEGSRFSFTLRRAVSSVRASLGGEKNVES